MTLSLPTYDPLLNPPPDGKLVLVAGGVARYYAATGWYTAVEESRPLQWEPTWWANVPT